MENVRGERKAKTGIETETEVVIRTGIAAAARTKRRTKTGTGTGTGTETETGIGTEETARDLEMMIGRGRSPKGPGAAGLERSQGAEILGSADQVEDHLLDLDTGRPTLWFWGFCSVNLLIETWDTPRWIFEQFFWNIFSAGRNFI